MKLNDYMRFTIAQGVYEELDINAGQEFRDVTYLFTDQDELDFCNDLILEIVELCNEPAE